MALGEAFITIKADTAQFKKQLAAELKVTLDEAQKLTNGYTKSQIAAAKLANKAIADAEKAAYKERDAMARASAAARTAADKKYEKDFNELLASETKTNKAAAREITDSWAAADRERVAAMREAEQAIAAAERALYAEIKASAKEAAAQQIESQRAVAASAKETAAAQAKLSGNLSSFADKAGSSVRSLGGTVTSFLVKPLEYSAIAATGAAAAIGFFGIKATTSLQSAKVAVEGIIGAQAQFNGNLDQGRAAGDAFFASLQQFAKVTPFRLQDLTKASQQLLGIGLSGDQVLGTLTDVGNALALTGDLSADRLNNVILAITQINALGKVTRDNIRQITSNAPTFNQAIFIKQIAQLQAVKDRGAGAVATTKDLAKAQADLGNGAVPASIGVQAILNTMKATPGAAGAMDRAMTTLTGTLSNFKDAVQISLTNAFLPQLPVIQKALNDMTPILSSFLDAVAPAVGGLISSFGPLIDKLLPSLQSLLLAITPILKTLIDALGPVLTGVIGALVPVFGALQVPLQQFVDAFLKALLPVLPQITSAMVQLVPSFAQLATALIPLAPLLVTIVSDGIKVLAELMPLLVPLIKTFVDTLSFLLSIPGAGQIFGIMAVGLGAMALTLGPLINAFKTLKTTIEAVRTARLLLSGTMVETGAIDAATGAATGGAVGGAAKGGKLLGAVKGLGRATIIGGVLIAAGEVGHAAGEKIDAAMNKSEIAMDKARAHADLLAPAYEQLFKHADKLGLSVDTLSQSLGDVGIQTLAASVQAGSYKDIASGMIQALESQGLNSDQTAIALEKMGVSTDNAQKAIQGIDTSGAVDDLYRFQVAALEANGAVQRTISDLQIAQALGGSISDPDGAFASAAAIAKATPSGSDNLSGLDSGLPPGGANSTGSSKAAAAAAKKKAAAAKIKAALADIPGDLKTIADVTSKQSASQIKTNFNALIKDLKDSGHAAMVKAAKNTEDLLIADAKKLKPLQDKITAMLSIAQPIRDNIIALGSVATPTVGISQTFLGITNNLAGAINQAQRFYAVIKQLKSEGLNPQSLKELIDAGPAALDLAEALQSGGQLGINQINVQESTLRGLGTDVANLVTPELYEAGKHAADGLVQGFQDSEKKITDEMNRVADNMAATFNKRIKAHSPSVVFDESAGHIVDGLTGGLDRRSRQVADASARMAQTTITFGPGSIAVNGGVNKPEQMGMMLGQGIVGVLQQRQTAAALNGTG